MIKKIWITFFFLTLLALANQASAAVSLSVTSEYNPKTKILFLGFDPTDYRLKSGASEISQKVKKNLGITNLFYVMNQSGAMEAIAESGEKISTDVITAESIPNFEKYNAIGIGAILVGQFDYGEDGNMEIRVRMWDVLDQRQLFGKFYSASKDNYRKVANIISNEIFKAITGEKSGIFSSQILYVSESGSLKKRTKKINLIDFDGEGRRILSDGRDLVLTPIFSKKQNEIFYLRYFNNRPQIFSMNLENLRTKQVGGFNGTTFAASANSVDSNLLLLSAILNGNTDIYEVNISKNSAKRLTKNNSIDTTASYSPDGKYIAFSSDRDEGQQIYIMDSNGSSVRRISFGGGSYSKPVWSPDGKSIAFTKIKGGQFFIGIMQKNGKGEKMLATGYIVEGAKWSPNGRYLIFSKKKSSYGNESIPKLWIVDVVTGFEFELPTPQNEGATDPDWIDEYGKN